MSSRNVTTAVAGDRLNYQQVWRHTLVRLLLTYLAPLLLLSVYFHLQYRSLAEESRQRHLMTIAESQASTLDLFLRERVANLTNVIDDPSLTSDPDQQTLHGYLDRLRRDSSTFVDLGLFDTDGTMISYAGPYPSLLGTSYGEEAWFDELASAESRYVITDMYLGFRQQPHFTIAVRGGTTRQPWAVRATLDPERLRSYLSTLRGAEEVHSVLVNEQGGAQLVSLSERTGHFSDGFVPPREPEIGGGHHHLDGQRHSFAYCWLNRTDWCLIVVGARARGGGFLPGFDGSLLAITVAVILAVFSAIVIRARKVVHRQKEEDTARRELSGQLHHAARLASVGELAAGVAHEINNPLAVIAEEAGLISDLTDPEFADELDPTELKTRLDSIQEAAFRARDITRKLLSFVRKTDVTLAELDINEVIEDALGGLLEREMAVSNIAVVRELAEGLPPVLADRGQIEQVLVNLMTNAADAVLATSKGRGEIEVSTSSDGHAVRIAVRDSGVGIPPEQMERIFMPFHTTKEVGKGTGLGLSVSYGIVRGYGGDIQVESAVGLGSTFTVVLPVEPRTPEAGQRADDAMRNGGR